MDIGLPGNGGIAFLMHNAAVVRLGDSMMSLLAAQNSSMPVKSMVTSIESKIGGQSKTGSAAVTL
jgi:hypothetical protein